MAAVWMDGGARSRVGARRAMLRERTRDAHEALDASVSAAGFFSDPTAYGDFLAAMAQWHHAVDAALARADVARRWPAWRDHRAADALARDLAAIGRTPTDPPHDVPGLSIEGAGALFGVLYVVLGSGLGARVLVKQAALLGFDAARGAAYLAAQAASGARWQQLLDDLEAAPLDDDEVDAMVAAANRAFAVAGQAVHRARPRAGVAA